LTERQVTEDLKKVTTKKILAKKRLNGFWQLEGETFAMVEMIYTFGPTYI
jgi:hypothetical protein